MPQKRRTKTLRGKGFKEFLQKANDWLKKTKILSKVAGPVGTALGMNPGTGAALSGAINALGYGKKRKTRGRGKKKATKSMRGRGYGGQTSFSAGTITL